MTASEFIGKIFFFSKKKSNKNDKIEKSEDDYLISNNLLCRFVLDGAGKKVGESIAIDEDIIIIKTKNKYLGVPLKHIEEKDKTLLVKGLIDKNKAREMGENWCRKALDGKE